MAASSDGNQLIIIGLLVAIAGNTCGNRDASAEIRSLRQAVETAAARCPTTQPPPGKP